MWRLIAALCRLGRRGCARIAPSVSDMRLREPGERDGSATIATLWCGEAMRCAGIECCSGESSSGAEASAECGRCH